MSKSLQYYSMIASKWIPNNPVDTFYPFFLTMLKDEEISTSTSKKLVESFENKYGFKINVFLLNNIIQRCVTNEMCSQENEFYKFDLENIEMIQVVSSFKTDSFEKDICEITDEFVKFCNDDSITEEQSQSVLTKFINKYDFSVVGNNYNVDTIEEEDIFLYFFIEYVKHIFTNKNRLYLNLVKICEGNMIRSILLNQDLENVKIFLDQLILLDTPVLLRILGYYGDFFKNEYIYLLDSWKSQGAKICIFEHSYYELVSILESSAKWVESASIDISKTSMVTLYFRSVGKTSIDIETEIVRMPKELKELKIDVINPDFEEYEYFNENEERIKKKIIEVYSRGSMYSNVFDYEDRQSIDYDAKSIYYTYLIRNNNKLKSINDSKAVFVTNNRGILTAVSEYHIEKYGKTLAPAIKDTYIGMLVLSNDSVKIKEYINIQLIAFCYNAYTPSIKVRKLYLKKIEEMSNQKKINVDDYVLLKNYSIINKLVTESTRGFHDKLSDNVIYDVLDSIKADLLVEEKKQHIEEIKSIKEDNESKISKMENIHHEKIDKINDEREKELKNIFLIEKNKRIKLGRAEYHKKSKKFNRWYFFISIVLSVVFIFTGVRSITKTYWVDILISFTVFLIALLQTIDFLVSKKSIVTKYMVKHITKIALKYDVMVDEINSD